MGRFIVRSIISTIITLLLVSMLLFFMIDIGSGDIAVKILGVFSTPEQRASYNSQLGFDVPAWQRYLDWLAGNDWRMKKHVGHPLVSRSNENSGEQEWWADVNGTPTRWRIKKGRMEAITLQPDGRRNIAPSEPPWKAGDNREKFFWGVDTHNNTVKWVKDSGSIVWKLTQSGLRKMGDGPREYVPLRKGLIRGDAGYSIQYNRPVSNTLGPRIKNTVFQGYRQ